MEQGLKTTKIAQYVKLFLKSGVIFLILFFLIIYIINNWDTLDEFTYDISWLHLSLSILSLCCSLLFLPLALGSVVRLLKYQIPFKRMCMVLFYSQIAKYLPGGIWGYVGRVYLYKKEGMSASDASACVALETILVLVSGIFVFGLSLLFGGRAPRTEWIPYEYYNEIGISVLIILLLLVHPKVLSFLWALVPMKFSGQRLQLKYSYFSVVKPAMLLVCFWLGVGGSFWLLIGSIYYTDVSLLSMAVGAYVLAWIMGFLVFFTPGGLGAREAVLVLALNLYWPISISTISAVAARLWWICGELIWTLLSFVWNGCEGIKKGNSHENGLSRTKGRQENANS
jgi:hypothetical protein